MQLITSTLLAALLASPLISAAVVPTPASAFEQVSRRQQMTCTASMIGINSEGGGGPGQAPLNNNQFGVTVGGTGSNETTTTRCSQSANDISCPTVDRSSYLGTYDTTCSGVWNGINISWDSCMCNNVAGVNQPSTISSGTVSETTSICVMTYDC